MLRVKSAYPIPWPFLYDSCTGTMPLTSLRSYRIVGLFFPCSPSALLADYAIAFPNQIIWERSKTAILYFQCRKQCSQKCNVLLKFKFTSSSDLGRLSAPTHNIPTLAAGLVSFGGTNQWKSTQKTGGKTLSNKEFILAVSLRANILHLRKALDLHESYTCLFKHVYFLHRE